MDQPEIAAHEAARDRGLVRAVGPWGLTASIVNGVIGAGIFALPAAMALAAGWMAPLAFLACALVMGAVVLCFAEAGSRVPTSGGSYGTVEAAFGPLAGFVAGMLVWTTSILACGAITAAFADTVGALAPAAGGAVARGALIVGAIGLIAWINIMGVRQGARLIGGMTLVKLAPLVLFVVVGGYAVLHTLPPPPAPAPSELGIDFGQAMILALFAFAGMEIPLAASGEVAEPARTVPRALIRAMAFVLLFYVAIQVVAQGLLGGDLAGSTAPLADAIGRVSPALGIVILVGAALSMFGWIASNLFGAPRILFAFARDGLAPRALAAVHPRTHTPWVAILVQAVLSAACALSGSFVQLAVLAGLAVTGTYFLACAAAWRLHRMDVGVVDKPLSFRALPLAAIVGMVSMVLIAIQADPAEIAGLVAVMAGSALLYAVIKQFRERPPRRSG